MKSPRPIALLVPCYNAASYLPRLAESVHGQTLPFSEILCYDDGSTDGTVEVARELGWRILTPNTNAGPASARNRLLAATDAEWIHFHDADDLLQPTFVKKMSDVLNVSPEADVVVCQMDWLTESTRALEIAWRYDGAALARDAISETIRNPIGVAACVYRKEALLKIGGFDETYRTWEDGDLHVRLAAMGAHFVVMPDMLSISLRTGKGASADGVAVVRDRIRQLERYLSVYSDRAVVKTEASRLAIWLVEHNWPEADQMLELCRRHRARVPETNNPIWRMTALLLPPRPIIHARATLRRWQTRLSRR